MLHLTCFWILTLENAQASQPQSEWAHADILPENIRDFVNAAFDVIVLKF